MFGAVVEDDALVEVLDQMHGVANAAMGVLLAALVEIDQRDTWQVDGCRSTAMWLGVRHGLSEATARQWVRVARGLVFCPAIAAAFDAGRLSWEQLVACVDLVAYGHADDAAVAADAVGRTAWELKRLARDARRVSLAQANERHRQRYVRTDWDLDGGGLRINGWLPDVEGKAVETALLRGADHQPDDPADAHRRPLGQRMADALVDLASATLAADTDPDRATVVIHVDAHALGHDTTAVDLATLELGPVIALATAHRLACDGRCQIVVDDLVGRTVDAAKPVHTPPRWLRRRVLDRDGHCRWPGCERQALLHVHHIRWWTRDHGPTEEANLCALCRFHHRLVHEGDWTIHGDPQHRLTFTHTDGHTLTTGPPPLRHDLRHQLGLRWNTDPPNHAA